MSEVLKSSCEARTHLTSMIDVIIKHVYSCVVLVSRSATQFLAKQIFYFTCKESYGKTQLRRYREVPNGGADPHFNNHLDLFHICQ